MMGLFKSMRDWLRGKGKVSLDDLKEVGEVARELNEWLRAILPIGPEIVPEMTYREAIAYFVDSRPKDARVTKGAMIMQDHPQGQLLTQVFLDRANDLVSDADGKPYGRRLVVKSVDGELRRTFGDKDLVIVE
jgi:hypothetical protein